MNVSVSVDGGSPIPNLVVISGGIGSGKSVVSKIIRILGCQVYDCDLEARRIMDSRPDIHEALCREIHPSAVENGRVNRPLISDIVFGDADALARLNAIVHGALRRHLRQWCLERAGNRIIFAECAIPRSSGILAMAADLWEVTAPVNVRISRVMSRNNLTYSQVEARVKSQVSENLDGIPHKTICNDNLHALLPQIHQLLDI